MKQRSIGLFIVFSIVTLGIYYLYWYIAFQMELKRKTGLGFGGLAHFLLSIVTFGIYPIYWYYAAGKRLEAAGGRDNGILYLILTLIGLGFVSGILMQDEANKIATA